MEASILATYPAVHLPERWRPGRDQDPAAPTLRRLLVLVNQLPPGTPLDRELNGDPPEWSTLHQVVDDSRRYLATALGVKQLPPPHPNSPHAKATTAKRLSPDRARRLAAAKARAAARRATHERR